VGQPQPFAKNYYLLTIQLRMDIVFHGGFAAQIGAEKYNYKISQLHDTL